MRESVWYDRVSFIFEWSIIIIYTCQWIMLAGQPLSTLESRHFRLTDEETPSFYAEKNKAKEI
jgi:hypothetical protein